MGGGAALWGGFSSFFSIWQLCIMQISPFFVAFITGLYLATLNQKAEAGIMRWVIPPCITYTAGFTLVYSLLIASGLSFSRPLLTNIGNLRILAGVIILLASLYIFLVNRLPSLGKLHHPLLLSVLSLAIGVSFALMYSPCISPMLSDIMGLASQRNTAVEGWYLAFCYGLGTSIALCLVSIVLILFLENRKANLRIATIKNVCGIILLAAAVMNITGLMRHYKAFILGFLV